MFRLIWGYGSVGRAPRSQRGGHEFESRYLHQTKKHGKEENPCFFFVPYGTKRGLRRTSDAIETGGLAIAIPSQDKLAPYESRYLHHIITTMLIQWFLLEY